MNRILHISNNHPISIVLLYVLMFLLSLCFYKKTPIDFNTAVSTRNVIVKTNFDGYGAEEIKDRISVPLEISLMSLTGLKNIQSISRDGVSIISIELKHEIEPDVAILGINDIIDRTQPDLPYGCPKSSVFLLPDKKPSFIYALVPDGSKLSDILSFAENSIRPELNRINHISEVKIEGGCKEEIQIEIQQEKLLNANLNLYQISEKIMQCNMVKTIGSVYDGINSFLVTGEEYCNNFENIEELILSYSDNNGCIKLKDLGKVKKNTGRQESFVHYNGEDCVIISIFSNDIISPGELSESVDKCLEELLTLGSCNYKILKIYDSTEYLKNVNRWVFFKAILCLTICFAVSFALLNSIVLIFIACFCVLSSLSVVFYGLYFSSNVINPVAIDGITIALGISSAYTIFTLRQIQIKGLFDGTKSTTRILFIITVLTEILFFPYHMYRELFDYSYSGFLIPILTGTFASFLACGSLLVALFSIFRNLGLIELKNKIDLNLRIISDVQLISLRKRILMILFPFVIFFVFITFFQKYKFEDSRYHDEKLQIVIQYPLFTSIECLSDYSLKIYNAISALNPDCKILIYGGSSDEINQKAVCPESEIETLSIYINSDVPQKLIIESIKAVAGNYSSIDIIGNKRISNNKYYINGESSSELRKKINQIKNITEVKFYPDQIIREKVFKPDFRMTENMKLSNNQIADCFKESIQGIVLDDFIYSNRKMKCRIFYEGTNCNEENFLNRVFINAGGFYIPLLKLGEIKEESVEKKFFRRNCKNTKIVEFKSIPDSKVIENFQLTSMEVMDSNETIINLVILVTFIILLIYFCLSAFYESFTESLYFMIPLFPLMLELIILNIVFKNECNIFSIFEILVMIEFILIVSVFFFESTSIKNKNKSNSLRISLIVFLVEAVTIIVFLPYIFSTSLKYVYGLTMITLFPFNICYFKWCRRIKFKYERR